MTLRQEWHLEYLKTHCTEFLDEKYRKGAEEHGGDIHDMTPLELLDEAIKENIDQFVYLMTAREKLTNAK